MEQRDIDATESAVLSVLGGTPIEEAARRAGTSPARLAEAVERYRAAGRAALDARTTGWYQTYITFADYRTAEDAFRTHLLPALRSEPVGAWWFVRKHPCWRLRVHPPPHIPVEDTVAHVTKALDTAVSRGAVNEWSPSLYEPETVAFGGTKGMRIAHALFHVDSDGVLDYHRHVTDRTTALLPDAKTTSLLVATLFLRAAGLEWGEQGDVWGQVEARRPLPDDVPVGKVEAMAEPLRRLLLLDPSQALADGPLAPLRPWTTGMQHGARALAAAARDGRLGLGLRGVLARHVLFHWNRMGFTTRQQAIWARAARGAILGQ